MFPLKIYLKNFLFFFFFFLHLLNKYINKYSIYDIINIENKKIKNFLRNRAYTHTHTH